MQKRLTRIFSLFLFKLTKKKTFTFLGRKKVLQVLNNMRASE